MQFFRYAFVLFFFASNGAAFLRNASLCISKMKFTVLVSFSLPCPSRFKTELFRQSPVPGSSRQSPYRPSPRLSNLPTSAILAQAIRNSGSPLRESASPQSQIVNPPEMHE